MLWDGPPFTPVSLQPMGFRIHYGETALFLGSCFSEHIGDRLRLLKYDVNQNPFGILYNPVSMANAVLRIIDRQLYTDSELVHYDGLYHSMDHHGSFSGADPVQVISHINASLQHAHDDLKKAKFIFISPGTSIVYRFLRTNAISGNCHKIPQQQFHRYQLSSRECNAAFLQMRNTINAFAPQAQVIWTISPVRHLSEGVVQNQRSKALLITAVAEMCNAFPGDYYFPAYEIMMDQLRDYRYYMRDMTHPSAEAIDIIWKAFAHMCLDEHELSIHTSIEKIQRAMSHRFLHDQPDARRKFAQAHLQIINEIVQKQPLITFEKETAYFQSLM